MCDFEDANIIDTYTRQQAVDDGVLVEVIRWKGKPVMITSHLYTNLFPGDLLEIWGEFLLWKQDKEQKLPEEERLFSMAINDKKVWIIEDSSAYTIMYPEDY